MTGNSYNKQSGQALLITIMLLATVLTVVIAITFKSTTETKVTKLEADARIALAAAEAAVEYALKNGSIVAENFNTLGLGQGITGSAEVSEVGDSEFTTPSIPQDGQYTFYLSVPNDVFTEFTSPYNGTMTVCYGTEALELTFVKTDYTIQRFVINPQGSTVVTNGTAPNNGGSCPSGAFVSKNQFPVLGAGGIGSNNIVLFIRAIGGGGRVGLKAGSGSFPVQGKKVISRASTVTGVTKSVQLFQSYPQISADFFVTRF